jgi:hypothetical protein
LVTALITGRIFLLLPAAYVSAEDAQKSLRAQLGLEVPELRPTAALASCPRCDARDDAARAWTCAGE